MTESLIITLREGIEAALVVGIILAYLKKTDRQSLSSFVYVGIGLAILASLAAAMVFYALEIDPENEYIEGAIMGVAAIFVASMVWWLQKTAKNIKGHMEGKLQSLVQEAKPKKQQGLGLLLFTFLM